MQKLNREKENLRKNLSNSFSKGIIFFLLTTFYLPLFLSGCANPPIVEKEEVTVFPEEVTVGEVIKDITSVKFVDNFDDGKEPNMIGGRQYKSSISGANISSVYDDTSPFGKSGFSCKISFNIPSNTWASWSEDLNGLDISKAEGLAFWIKGEINKNDFEIILSDYKGNSKAINSKEYIEITDFWKKIEVPAEKFSPVDFNYMDKLTLKFKADNEPVIGTIYIDNIYFYGQPFLFFHSLKDNLYDFPDKKIIEAKTLFLLSNEQLLRRIAEDGWGYFKYTIDSRTFLPADYIDMNEDRIYRIGDYTSPTNIGLYFMCVIGAYDLGLIDKIEAVTRINNTITTLKKLPRYKGLWYNFYSTTNLQITREYISSVDNGWLAAGFIIVRQAFPEEFGKVVSQLLDEMDFSMFYDPVIGQIYLGYEKDKEEFTPYHYGLIATEPRVTSFIAIGKGDIPKDHWFRIYRTLPQNWSWQRQIPKGSYKRYHDVDVFEGYYTYKSKNLNLKIVPSWGGSMFEFLMPTLVLNEKEYSPYAFGLNNSNAIRAHMDYALNKKGFPVWGLSPCSTPEGGYKEFGVADLGVKGYENDNVVTPHASILAVNYFPEEVVENIRNLLELYDIYGEYGLYDSVDVLSNRVSYRYLCLDQAMVFISLVNYLCQDSIRKRFHSDPISKVSEELIRMEHFFN